MSLKGIKILLRVIGALVFLSGLYLIFVEKQFFGIFILIAALLILPSVEEKPKNIKMRAPEKKPESETKEKPSKAVDSDGGSNWFENDSNDINTPKHQQTTSPSLVVYF